MGASYRMAANSAGMTPDDYEAIRRREDSHRIIRTLRMVLDRLDRGHPSVVRVGCSDCGLCQEVIGLRASILARKRELREWKVGA